MGAMETAEVVSGAGTLCVCVCKGVRSPTSMYMYIHIHVHAHEPATLHPLTSQEVVTGEGGMRQGTQVVCPPLQI